MELRAATVDETEQIVALQCDRNGADCDEPVRRLLAREDVGPARFAVAVDDDGAVVSSLCLIPERLRIGGAIVEVGQVEYVATRTDFERRGLVRALMDVVHRWSADDGHLVQLIAGIPYFYRRFGYEYAVPFHRLWILEEPPLRTPSAWTVRPAEAGDAEVTTALQLEALGGVPLAVLPPTSGRWRERLVGDVDPRWLVAERNGSVEAVAMVGSAPPGFGDLTMVGAFACAGEDPGAALDAFLATSADGAHQPVAAQERPLVDELLAGRAARHARQYSLYARVPDVRALLDHLRPVLTARLRASAHASLAGELLVSFYRHAVRLRIEAGAVIEVEAVAGEQAPTSLDGIGIPPDLVATLVLGKHGAGGLAERHEDVQLGDRAELAEVLFPRLERDIALL